MPENAQDGQDKHGHLVEVTIDNASKEIQAKEYVVSKLKEVLGVDATRELEQVINGVLTPLEDSARIHITGGEVFVSHVRRGGSSRD